MAGLEGRGGEGRGRPWATQVSEWETECTLEGSLEGRGGCTVCGFGRKQKLKMSLKFLVWCGQEGRGADGRSQLS